MGSQRAEHDGDFHFHTFSSKQLYPTNFYMDNTVFLFLYDSKYFQKMFVMASLTQVLFSKVLFSDIWGFFGYLCSIDF